MIDENENPRRAGDFDKYVEAHNISLSWDELILLGRRRSNK